MSEGNESYPNRRQLNTEELGRLAATEYIQPTQETNYGLVGRWEVYRFATEPMDYYARAFEALASSNQDTLLDIGCSDGVNLIAKRAGGHKGMIMGVDISPEIFHYGSTINSKMNVPIINPIQFIAATGEQLPLRDNSIDGITCLFMLYHATSADNVLTEMKRVLKPGGRAVVATSGPKNKQMQRILEERIADDLGIEPPPLFTAPFDTTIAEKILPNYFEVIDTIVQDCEIRIPDPFYTGRINTDGLHAYLNSINSMRKHFNPVPTELQWLKVTKRIIFPALRADFQENGYFTDHADRKLYVCTIQTPPDSLS